MKYQICLLLLFVLALTSCGEENPQTEFLNEQWTLVGYDNIMGQMNCEFDEREIVWTFKDSKLKIEGRLIPPFEFVPCLKTDKSYEKEVEYKILTTDIGLSILIEDLDFEANFVDSPDVILEIISAGSEFQPSREGVNVFFKKL